MLGKLNMTEWATPLTLAFPYGQPCNPWNVEHDAGGSSTGSGSATAAALCAGALGEDTGGSIRRPAANNSCVGLRPSWGRVSMYGVIPAVWSQDTAGPLTRTVADCALLMNVIAGYTGYPAFGNVVFFGLSSYCTALLSLHYPDLPFWCTVLAGAALSPLLALLVGPILLRLKGHYFAIATLGLNEMVREIVSNMTIAGGGSGLSLPLTPWSAAANAIIFYYMFLGAMFLSIVVVWQFSRRKIGLVCRVIRDDERKAEAIGLHTTRDKTIAWMLSAALTGLVGAINAHWMTFINPASAFDLGIAVEAYVAFLAGGAATVWGPIFGATLLEMISTLSWAYLLKWHLAVMGLLVMLVALAAPSGIWVALERLLGKASAESGAIAPRRIRPAGDQPP